jgi:hypothetical protein
MRAVHLIHLRKIYLCKKNEMVRIYDTHTHCEYMEVHVILTEILNRIDPLKNVTVDMRIILE